jgi:DNA-binding transcriptional MerR regulator/methylmalonyl-CoA mutase cobalamin-binding subunit
LYKADARRNLRFAVFRIRHAAKMAGINPTLLRAWERRYRLVTPQRTPSGYRVYSPADIDVLKAAARMVSAGHSISEVARLPAAQLMTAAAGLDQPPPAAGDLEPANSSVVAARSAKQGTIDAALAAALQAVRAFDREQFEAALFPLTTMGDLPPVVLCERVLLPLLALMGDAWERGELTVAAEHFGSALCRTKILQCLAFLVRTGTGPRVVCACPEHELHEGGLLAFAVRAAAEHWQVIYLGPNTPLVQALETAISIEAELVALSLTIAPSAAASELMLTAVKAARKARPSLRVLAGGRAAMAARAQLEAAGVEIATHISAPLPSAPLTEKMRPG